MGLFLGLYETDIEVGWLNFGWKKGTIESKFSKNLCPRDKKSNEEF